MKVGDLPTPALVVDVKNLHHNLMKMRDLVGASRLRPHVKAHKCSRLAELQLEVGATGLCGATVRELVGLARAGLGHDLVLANECVDEARLRACVEICRDLTVCVDSIETVLVARAAGVARVLIDVNVGLPRCGVSPESAGWLAGFARKNGLEVRGVMGYEGHVMGLADSQRRLEGCRRSMELLMTAHEEVGGELMSAGGTGTSAFNVWANDIQAGSYVFMDSAYGELGLEFRQSLWVLGTVISRTSEYVVCDVGLKALGMDHGNARIESASVLFHSDEHTTFVKTNDLGPDLLRIGDRVRVVPGHIDPTVAYHEQLYLCDEDSVVDTWPIDLRGW